MEYKLYKTIDELFFDNRICDVFIIDCTIGLSDLHMQENYRPDKQLRSIIKNKSSVFNVPLREIVYEENDKIAWELNRKHDVKLTPMSMAVRKQLKEVDLFLCSNEAYSKITMESHPEFVFELMNNNIPLSYSKHTDEGITERINILRNFVPNIDNYVKDFAILHRKQVNDFLDATCLAIQGNDGLNCGFSSIPENPQRDSKGLLMQIVYSNNFRK